MSKEKNDQVEYTNKKIEHILYIDTKILGQDPDSDKCIFQKLEKIINEQCPTDVYFSTDLTKAAKKFIDETIGVYFSMSKEHSFNLHVAESMVKTAQQKYGFRIEGTKESGYRLCDVKTRDALTENPLRESEGKKRMAKLNRLIHGSQDF